MSTHSDARNLSLSGKVGPANGKHNGFTNLAYVNGGEKPDLLTDVDEKSCAKKGPAPLPPSQEKIESTIAVLDEILEKEEALSNRKYSVDSLSIADANLMEHVEADVHHSDIPNTPIIVITTPPPSPALDNRSCESFNIFPSSNVANDELASNTSPPPAAITSATNDKIDNTDSNQLDETSADPPKTPPFDSENPELVETLKFDEVIIPPPPPYLTAEIQLTGIPRPRFSISDFSGVSLKSPPKSPVDSREKIALSDGHIKFGSEEHKAFLRNLNDKLSVGGIVPNYVTYPTRESVVQEPIPNEDVIEENINKNDATEKLKLFLQKSPDLVQKVLPPLPKNIVGDGKDVEKESSVDETEESNTKKIDEDTRFRKNMDDVFQTLRLRKKESFNENDENISDKQ